MYVDHMDAKDGKSSIKPKDPNIKIATPEDVERLWKLRRERREAGE